MKLKKLTGIVINKKDVLDADRIVSLFTKEYGKVDVYIYGIKKTKSREIVSTEILSISEFITYEKKDFYIANKITAKKIFYSLRSNIDKLQFLYYILKVINEIYDNNQKDIKLYSILEKTLYFFDSSDNKKMFYYIILYFLKEIIYLQGIQITIENGNFFSLENGIINENQDNSVKLSNVQLEVINDLMNHDSKYLISKNYSIKEVFSVIQMLEMYINYSLNTKIKIKNFITED